MKLLSDGDGPPCHACGREYGYTGTKCPGKHCHFPRDHDCAKFRCFAKKERAASKQAKMKQDSQVYSTIDAAILHTRNVRETSPTVFTKETISAPYIRVPGIRSSLLYLTKKLSCSIEYSSLITSRGGVDGVTEHLFSCIMPQVLPLQLAVLTATGLNKTKLTQKPQKPQNKEHMGYLSFVTDNRDSDYFRLYVGQTSKGIKRILEHMNAIISGHYDTLHYYIVYLGNGARSAHFITLWRLDEDTDDLAWTRFRQNALELFFCFIFQTLPYKAMDEVSERNTRTGEYEALGLNILSPLFQDNNPSVAARDAARKLLLCSKDEEIRSWPKFRANMKGVGHGIHERPSTTFPIEQINGDHIQAALRSLPFPFSAQDIYLEPKKVENGILTSIFQNKEPTAVSEAKMLIPFGTLHARIGFVIDGSCGLECPPPTVSMASTTLTPPFDLLNCGFTDENVFISTFDLQPLKSLEEEFASASETVVTGLRRAISSSALQVVFLWGSSTVQSFAKELSGQEQRFEIKLRNQAFISYALKSRTSQLFIQLPTVPPLGWPRTASCSMILGDILLFASQITNTAKIQPYIIDGRLALRTILFYYCRDDQAETDGFSFTDLDPSLQSWITQKGFKSKEEIEKLKGATGGSLVAALLMLYRKLHPLLDADFKAVPYPRETVDSKLEKHQRKHYPKRSTERVMQLYNRLNSHISLPDCSQPGSATDGDFIPLQHDKGFDLVIAEQGIYETREDLTEPQRIPNIKIAEQRDHSRAPTRTRVHRPPRERYNWREEAAHFTNRVYHVNIPTERRVHMFSMAFQDIALPHCFTDIGNGDLEVDICKTEDLSRHEHCRAIDSKDDDPGKALAIFISGHNSKEERFSFWSRTSGIRTVERMNTLADILIEQAPRKEILRRAKRYKTRIPKLPGSNDR